jgi:hypothetical protein
MAWQRFTVQLKGEDPITVAPNALDWRFVRMDPQFPMDGMWQAVHHALLRADAEVPRDYEGFLEALDGMPEAADDVNLSEVGSDPLARTPATH